MKILVILPESEPFSPSFGGALAIWVRNIYRNLSNLSVTIISPPSRDEYDGFILYHIKKQDILLTIYNYFPKFIQKLLPGRIIGYLINGYIRRVVNYTKQNSFDVIHILNRPWYVSTLRHSNPNASLILHLQNDHLLHYSYQQRADILSMCDHVLFCSRFILENALGELPESLSKKCSVIYNGVDCKYFRPGVSYSSYVTNLEGRYILFVGRLVSEKGIHVLFEAFSKIFKQIHDCKLLIVGGAHFGNNNETTYVKKLRQQAEIFQERIHFTGSVSHQDLPGIFANAAAFVCPSLWEEPFGIVNVEAMACGIPVIASNRGGIPEAIGDSGILFDPDQPESLAEALTNILNKSSLAQSFSEKAVNRARSQFDWRIIAKQFEELLKSMC
jgi:spore coat protein SA